MVEMEKYFIDEEINAELAAKQMSLLKECSKRTLEQENEIDKVIEKLKEILRGLNQRKFYFENRINSHYENLSNLLSKVTEEGKLFHQDSIDIQLPDFKYKGQLEESKGGNKLITVDLNLFSQNILSNIVDGIKKQIKKISSITDLKDIIKDAVKNHFKELLKEHYHHLDPDIKEKAVTRAMEFEHVQNFTENTESHIWEKVSNSKHFEEIDHKINEINEDQTKVEELEIEIKSITKQKEIAESEKKDLSENITRIEAVIEDKVDDENDLSLFEEISDPEENKNEGDKNAVHPPGGLEDNPADVLDNDHVDEEPEGDRPIFRP